MLQLHELRSSTDMQHDACGQDQSGRPVPVWQGCRVIGDGEIFLMNPDEPASLDGRYFGPIPIAVIAGLAEPMWTSAEDRPCVFDASPMPVSSPCRARSDHAASGRECRPGCLTCPSFSR